jgi:hypothetical protein
MNSRLAILWPASARCLAINCDHILPAARDARHPAREACLESRNIKARQNVTRMVMRRCTIIKWQKLTQQIKPFFTKTGDLHELLAIANNRHEA